MNATYPTSLWRRSTDWEQYRYYMDLPNYGTFDVCAVLTLERTAASICQQALLSQKAIANPVAYCRLGPGAWGVVRQQGK